MEARLVTIGESEIRKQVAEEFDKLKDKVYENAIKDVIPQFTAVCMYILHREYGFGEKRLKHFLDSLNAEFEIMDCSVLGKEYSPEDYMNFLKNEYKIDVDKELTK